MTLPAPLEPPAAPPLTFTPALAPSAPLPFLPAAASRFGEVRPPAAELARRLDLYSARAAAGVSVFTGDPATPPRSTGWLAAFAPRRPGR